VEYLQSLIETYQRYVLTTHVNPDGDALGSQLAFAALLRSRSKDVRIINCDDTPPNYRFLDPDGCIEVFTPAQHRHVLMNAELIFLIDTNDPYRLRSMSQAVLASPSLKVIIDHHPEPVDVGTPPIIDIDAAATGEMMYRFILKLDPAILTADVSTALYTAIMTDSGSFRFPKTDPETHRIAADLISRGADPTGIYAHVYDSGSLNRLRLLGQMLSGITTSSDGSVGYAVITMKMFDETQTSEVDTDGFINYTLGIGGVRIGLLFVEQPAEVKISFRSKGNIPINELAKEFGGNGHRNAAGARLRGIPFDEVVQRILTRADSFLR
jgi:bifunctional oligoribonuclease and PAP phosphatase NrnA